jgi:hypothetical protein
MFRVQNTRRRDVQSSEYMIFGGCALHRRHELRIEWERTCGRRERKDWPGITNIDKGDWRVPEGAVRSSGLEARARRKKRNVKKSTDARKEWFRER